MIKALKSKKLYLLLNVLFAKIKKRLNIYFLLFYDKTKKSENIKIKLG